MAMGVISASFVAPAITVVNRRESGITNASAARQRLRGC